MSEQIFKGKCRTRDYIEILCPCICVINYDILPSDIVILDVDDKQTYTQGALNIL